MIQAYCSLVAGCSGLIASGTGGGIDNGSMLTSSSSEIIKCISETKKKKIVDKNIEPSDFMWKISN